MSLLKFLFQSIKRRKQGALRPSGRKTSAPWTQPPPQAKPFQQLRSISTVENSPKEWARRMLSMGHNCVILDCETTGLGEADEIVQLAIINTQGQILFNSLIKPTPKKRISPKAQQIHGITKEKLKNAPAFGDVLKEIVSIINNKTVVTYNAAFDRRLFFQTFQKYPEADVGEITKLSACFECAMKAYSAYIGEWNEYKNDFKWQKLPGGDHSALGDCMATLKIIQHLASS